MADDIQFSDFTTSEKVRVAALTARMAKRGLAGPNVDLGDLKRRIERIEKQVRKRIADGK